MYQIILYWNVKTNVFLNTLTYRNMLRFTENLLYFWILMESTYMCLGFKTKLHMWECEYYTSFLKCVQVKLVCLCDTCWVILLCVVFMVMFFLIAVNYKEQKMQRTWKSLASLLNLPKLALHFSLLCIPSLSLNHRAETEKTAVLENHTRLKDSIMQIDQISTNL